ANSLPNSTIISTDCNLISVPIKLFRAVLRDEYESCVGVFSEITQLRSDPRSAQVLLASKRARTARNRNTVARFNVRFDIYQQTTARKTKPAYRQSHITVHARNMLMADTFERGVVAPGKTVEVYFWK